VQAREELGQLHDRTLGPARARRAGSADGAATGKEWRLFPVFRATGNADVLADDPPPVLETFVLALGAATAAAG
jgi:hypothetical protein